MATLICKECGFATSSYEAQDRNFNTGKCARCDGELEKSSLLPTQKNHVRTCPDGDCIQWTHVLSTQDKPHGRRNGFPVYERTTKWKCDRGHRTDTKRLVDMEGRTVHLNPSE